MQAKLPMFFLKKKIPIRKLHSRYPGLELILIGHEASPNLSS